MVWRVQSQQGPGQGQPSEAGSCVRMCTNVWHVDNLSPVAATPHRLHPPLAKACPCAGSPATRCPVFQVLGDKPQLKSCPPPCMAWVPPRPGACSLACYCALPHIPFAKHACQGKAQQAQRSQTHSLPATIRQGARECLLPTTTAASMYLKCHTQQAQRTSVLLLPSG